MNKEDIEALISEVYIRTPIWDSNHVDHLNPVVTKALWIEIEKKLGHSKNLCRWKWKYLKHSYRREIKKICGIYGLPKTTCTWQYYKQLSYLKPHVMTGELSVFDLDFDKDILFTTCTQSKDENDSDDEFKSNKINDRTIEETIDVEALITEVSIRRPLWDITDKDHFNPAVANVLWFEIEEKLGKSKNLCKAKWRLIRHTFRREIKKICGMFLGRPPKKLCTWPYYQQLSFMKEQMLTGDISGVGIDFDKDVTFEPLKTKTTENRNSTKMDVEAFISEVQIRPSLWDRTDTNRFNSDIKNSLWREISKKIGVSVNICKEKWKYLKRAYRREMKKICGLFSDKPPKTTNIWQYYGQLSFLKEEMLTGELKHIDIDFDKNLIIECLEDSSNDVVNSNKIEKTLEETADIEALISEVSIRTPIWDSTHKDHLNSYVTKSLWLEIEEALGFSTSMCKWKWKNLLLTYRDEVKRIYDLFGKSPITESKWPYYQQMSFLKSEILTRDLSHIDTDFDKDLIIESLDFEEHNNSNDGKLNYSDKTFEERADIEVLISEVFIRTPIWDITHEYHKNQNVINKLWSEIEEALGFSKFLCIRKWKYLLYTYRKIIHQMCDMYSGKPSKTKCTWPYYRQLSFLKSEILIGDLSRFDIDFDQNIIFELPLKCEQYNAASKEDTKSIESPPAKKRKYEETNLDNDEEEISCYSSNNGNEFDNIIYDPENSNTSDTIMDSQRAEQVNMRTIQSTTVTNRSKRFVKNPNKNINKDSLFFKSLLSFMKEFTPLQKLKVRNRIQMVIFQELYN